MNLFYPDYLLMTNDGKFFIVETKGGEDSEGESRNIDKDKVELKFNALKNYVAIHNESHPEQNIEFAFVRDVEMSDDLGNKTYQLFYDNTTWAEDMTTEWESLDKLF